MGMTRTNAVKILKKLELEVEGKTREEVNEMIRECLGLVFDEPQKVPNAYILKLARGMVDKLIQMLDYSEVSTVGLLYNTYGENIHPAGDQLMYLIQYDGKERYFDILTLHYYFHKEAVKRGFVIDNCHFLGMKTGWPFDIVEIYRNLKKLLSSFDKIEYIKNVSVYGYNTYFRKEILEINKEFKTFRSYLLLKITSGSSTGCIDTCNSKSQAIVIQGKGISTSSHWVYAKHDSNEEASWEEDYSEMNIKKNDYCYYLSNKGIDSNVPPPNYSWFKLTNIGKGNLIVLLIREYDSWKEV